MLEKLKSLFLNETYPDDVNKTQENVSLNKKLQLATCAIFLEMARVDYNVTEEERKEIISIMKQTFGLEKHHIDELIDLALRQLDQTVSIYEFTDIINKNFSHEEKFELIKNLWRLIYADKKLDKYEDQLIKKIGAVLNLDHKKDVIAAKLLVKEEMQKKNS